MIPAVTVELEAEGIADGDDQLAATQALRIADRRRRQVAGGIGAEECEVGVGILADKLRVGGAALRIGKTDFAEAVDDVAVGDDQSVGRDDEAGPEPAALPVSVPRVDAHDRRPDLVGDAGDRVRVGIEETAVIDRAALVTGGRFRIGVIEDEVDRSIEHGDCPSAIGSTECRKPG